MNKHIINKISGMIIVLMFAFAFSVQVCAAGLEGEPVSGYCEYVSPFYEPEDDFDVALLEEADSSSAPVYKVSTREGLLEAIRKALADRVPAFTVNSTRYFELQPVFDEIYDHTGNPRYGDYLRWNSSKINCSVSGYMNNANYYFTSVFHSNTEQEKAVDAKMQEVMVSLELDGKDEYGKIKAIYDYICSSVEYDYDNLDDESYTLKHSTYAALIDGKAVCQGYATLLYRMYMEAGIDARVITGYAGEAHAWNIVKLGKYYYYMDSTWDAGNERYDYFLRGGYFENHRAESEYTTGEFTAKYPIAKRYYVEGQGDIDYRLTDDGKTLVVFGSGNMVDIVGEAQLWYMDMLFVNRVIVEEGVTNIAGIAFDGSPIVWAEIADSVEYIGERAFSNCTELQNIRLGSGLKEIRREAFRNCKRLKNITIPANVTVIEENAFSGIQGLTIWGYRGTAAEAYAGANGIMFIPVVDFNGSGDTGDFEMVIILDTIKGIADLPEEGIQTVKQVADVNGDGAFDIRDYNIIYKAVYGE